MIRLKFQLVVVSCLFLPFVQSVKNVEHKYIEDDCFENKSQDFNSTDVVGVTTQQIPRHDVVLSRVKRSFGGKEPVNMTLINTNVLGPNGWLPLACGASLDVFFHVSGYFVLGNILNFEGTR